MCQKIEVTFNLVNLTDLPHSLQNMLQTEHGDGQWEGLLSEGGTLQNVSEQEHHCWLMGTNLKENLAALILGLVIKTASATDVVSTVRPVQQSHVNLLARIRH